MKSFTYVLSGLLALLFFPINSFTLNEEYSLDTYTNPDKNSLPAEILAFPDFTTDYEKKIRQGNYQVWSERKIVAWARGQGFIMNSDSDSGGLQFKQGAVFLPPGLSFSLYRPTTEKGANNSTGWSLVLDLGMVSPETLDQNLEFQNILRYEIFIDSELFLSAESGYGKGQESPVVIQIPYIRDTEGKVSIEIRIKNHPRHFGVLYDARLERLKLNGL